MHKQVKAYYEMAYEYHISALTLLNNIFDAPYLYNPIAYLLRHTIELQLKGIIVKELRKDNRRLVIKQIKIDSRSMNSTHSLLTLWNFCKRVLSAHEVHVNESDLQFIDKLISNVDSRDFTSTKYRYPFDKNDKATDLLPVDIDMCGKAPDLAEGIPTIIQHGENVGVINKGQRAMKDTFNLLETVEILFSLIE